MNLFRSEEHAPEGGDLIPAETLWRLADAWYRDRLATDWRPRTQAENRAILDSLGLTGPMWRQE